MLKKPFAEACQRNRDPILQAIQPLLKNAESLLEIGSGTGQHAVYFAAQMPHLCWQTSDLKENHYGIQQWIDASQLNNVLAPLSLDVLIDPRPGQAYDAVYSANTAHIMPWNAVEAMFNIVGSCLNPDGILMLYGPFNYHGQFTSESNRAFESWLKSIDPRRGIRDFEALQQLANQQNLNLLHDIEMPANNRILVWQKTTRQRQQS